MLHSVRYLQSQWNARSPELTLRDLVSFIKPNASPALLERARRHYHACRLQCFLRGIAVAVDGPLPNTGVLLIGTPDDPDHLVGSIRPCLEVTASKLPPERFSLRVTEVAAALAAGISVYLRVAAEDSAFLEAVLAATRAPHTPVLNVTVRSSGTAAAAHAPLSLREVRIELSPRSTTTSDLH